MSIDTPNPATIPDGWNRIRPDFYEGPRASAFVRGGQFVIDQDTPDEDGSYGVPAEVARAVLGAPTEAEALCKAIAEIRAAVTKAGEVRNAWTIADLIVLHAKLEWMLEKVPA